MSKQYKPNIVRGGIAVPLGNNYFFMKGRKHKQGGIDVGKDLEVEDGEVMKLTKDNIKVFSAVPFLNGQSPVEKLLGGEDPNKVFDQQERFKKVNKINDDGTKAQLGKGKKITTTEIPESQQYAVTTPDGQRKVFNSKQEASDYITANTPKGYSLYDTTNYGTNIDKGQTAILNRNTEREIEKAIKQEELAKARLATRQQNQQIGKEMLSYMPVIGDGMDLYQLGKDIYNKQYGNAAISLAALTMPAWAEPLVKPIGKIVKKGYGKVRDKLFPMMEKSVDKIDNAINTVDEAIVPSIKMNVSNPHLINNNNDIINTDFNTSKGDHFVNSFINTPTVSRNTPTVNHNATIINHNTPTITNRASIDRVYKFGPYTPSNIDNIKINGNQIITSNNKTFDLDQMYFHGLDHDDVDDILYVLNNNNELKNKVLNHPNYMYFNNIEDFMHANRYPNNYLFNSSDEFLTNSQGIQFNLNGQYIKAADGTIYHKQYLNPELFKDIPYHYSQSYIPTRPSNLRQYDASGKLIDVKYDTPHFTLENYPGKDRTKLVLGDKNSMAHFNLTPDEYKLKMIDEYNRIPHGGAVGFDHDGSLSTSSSAMFPLQLINHLKNKRVAKIFMPIGPYGDNMQSLNNFGRKYYKDTRGKVRAIPDNKDIINGTYNGNHVLTNDEWVDWWNETRLKPLIEASGVQFPKAEIRNGRIYIPNMAAIKLQMGGKTKAPFGTLKKIGQSLGLIKEDKKTESILKETEPIRYKNEKISTYIGGKPNEARQKYYDIDKELTDSIKVISTRYGLNPNLVASRIAKEGPIDKNINYVNQYHEINKDPETGWRGPVYGEFWGLDDTGSNIEEGKVVIKEPWNGISTGREFINEKNRKTNTISSGNFYDGIYATAAELKYRRDYMKQHFPNMTDEQLDAAAAASFNRGIYGTRKWINNKGNYMQYKPFIQLKKMGGNHKLNTNQMANIYRVDSNGKTTWGMNFSTGGKSKGKIKAELGLKTKNDGSYYGYVKKDNKGNTWYIPTDEDLKLMYPGLAEDVDYNTLSDYDKMRYDEREGVREGYRVLPTGGIFYSDNETIFVNDEQVKSNKTNKKQTTPNTSATKTTPKSNVTNKTSNITTPNNVTRTAPIDKSTSQETPIFGLDAQNAFKKSIIGNKSNPDYIRGTFDFRDNKELVNKVDPSTIKVNPTNIRYKGSPSNGNYFKNYNAGDYISLGANVLGNIGSALINKHTLDNMEYASAPVPKIALKQKTNFNINPQLDLSRERLREGVSDININTASSSTALNRNNKLRLANIMNTNQLYGTKENMETQLINADRMNQQNVFNSNIDAFNTWNKEKNIFETAKQEKYGENKVGAVQGISQAVHDFINNNEKRRQFNNSLIFIMAANPNVNPELYKVLGADWITDEHIRNWKLANNYKV